MIASSYWPRKRSVQNFWNDRRTFWSHTKYYTNISHRPILRPPIACYYRYMSLIREDTPYLLTNFTSTIARTRGLLFTSSNIDLFESFISKFCFHIILVLYNIIFILDKAFFKSSNKYIYVIIVVRPKYGPLTMGQIISFFVFLAYNLMMVTLKQPIRVTATLKLVIYR
jgi:hypothetical protein